jgi:hypothetical protein
MTREEPTEKLQQRRKPRFSFPGGRRSVDAVDASRKPKRSGAVVLGPSPRRRRSDALHPSPINTVPRPALNRLLTCGRGFSFPPHFGSDRLAMLSLRTRPRAAPCPVAAMTLSRPSRRIILLCRYPLPGLAKTRLIPQLGPDGAASVHRRLVLRTLRTLRSFSEQHDVPIEVHTVGAPETAWRHWLRRRPDLPPAGLRRPR